MKPRSDDEKKYIEYLLKKYSGSIDASDKDNKCENISVKLQ